MTQSFSLLSAACKQAIALAVCLGWLASCSGPPDKAPREDNQAPKIVSLNPCLDAILVEVAPPNQILALSHYSRDPSASSVGVERAAEFGVTGGTVEEVAALAPDLVLAGSFMAPATRTALDDLGLELETFGIASTLEESMVQVEQISDAVGNPSAGKELNARIEGAVNGHGIARPQASLSTVLWQPGQIVPGDTTLIAQLMDRAGFSSHNSALGLSQADYLSLEMLIANPPDVILIAGDSAGQRHQLLTHLPNTQIASFDPQLLYCGGPSIISAMERLSDIRAQLSAEDA